jgi:hypothetical protein
MTASPPSSLTLSWKFDPNLVLGVENSFRSRRPQAASSASRASCCDTPTSWVGPERKMASCLRWRKRPDLNCSYPLTRDYAINKILSVVDLPSLCLVAETGPTFSLMLRRLHRALMGSKNQVCTFSPFRRLGSTTETLRESETARLVRSFSRYRRAAFHSFTPF